MGGEPGMRAANVPHGSGGAAAGLIDRTLAMGRRGPLGAALRVGVMAIAAVAAAWIHRANDPGVLCPLRAFTGVPCPLCGGTTVFIELGSGHPVQAVAANPVAFTGAVGLAVAPLGPGGRWWALPPRARTWILGTALAGSELWQLARFGLLRS